MAAERIILNIDDGFCQEKCSCSPIACSAECEHIDKPTFSYTRQEAIERMNHAICVEIHGPCDICEQVKGGNEGHCNDYKKYAEAALNALLEASNER